VVYDFDDIKNFNYKFTLFPNTIGFLEKKPVILHKTDKNEQNVYFNSYDGAIYLFFRTGKKQNNF